MNESETMKELSTEWLIYLCANVAGDISAIVSDHTLPYASHKAYNAAVVLARAYNELKRRGKLYITAQIICSEAERVRLCN